MFHQTFPIDYIEPVFRPPSEARSLILPVTNGCSWNQCTFCEMYTAPQKKFSVRPEAQVLSELQKAAKMMDIRRIFLADGDAMALSTRRLMTILEGIKKEIPNIGRVSSYCLPSNVKNKSVAELKELVDAGLSMAYIGCESGDDEVLAMVNKGETYASSLSALNKLGEAGMTRSVMILNGLGGSQLSAQHADRSAQLMNEAQPEYLSTLVVSFPLGMERFKSRYPEFKPLDQAELFIEVERFLRELNLDKTVFRSDHASNYLVLKGQLGRDKEALLAQVRQAIAAPEHVHLRQEWQRGL